METTNNSGSNQVSTQEPFKPKKQFMGHPVIEVDCDTYEKCRNGKTPYERWKKYFDDNKHSDVIEYCKKNNSKSILLQNKTGGMSYLRNKEC
jgi:hypothetical protein